VVATAGIGSFSEQISKAIAISGVSGTSHIGSLSDQISKAIAITGVSGTSHIGSLSDQISKAIAITGVSGTSHIGSLSDQISKAIAITGVSGTSHIGSLSEQISNILSGVLGTSYVSFITDPIVIYLIGVVGTSNIGSLSEQIQPSISGVYGTGNIGSLSEQISSSVTLSGVQGTSHIGSLSDKIAIILSGVVGTSHIGSLSEQTQHAISGIHGIGQIGRVATSSSTSIKYPTHFLDFPTLTPVYKYNPRPRGAVIIATFVGPNVKVIVGNSYTGPAISSVVIIQGPPTVVAYANASSTVSIVGHPIMVYKIPQIIAVTYPASTSNGGHFLNNYPINRTNFRLIRSVQNEITFYVRDVDRKPVSIGFVETLTINIVDLETQTTLMTRNLSTINASSGIYLLTVLPAEMNDWPTT